VHHLQLKYFALSFQILKCFSFLLAHESSCPTLLAPLGQRHLPARGGDVAPSSEIKSTPIAVGMAAVSENVTTLGVKCVSLLRFSYTDVQFFPSCRVKNLRPWVSPDVEAHTECEIDTMIEKLLYRCKDKTKPDPDKSVLLRKALNAVLTICNDGKTAQDIKEYLNHL
jgi:hypothetical protein